MKREILIQLVLLVCALGCGLAGVSAKTSNGKIADKERRPVTVADCIRMTTLGDPAYFAGGPALDHVAQFSPDGKKFVVVVRKGNLEANTNEFSLLLWHTDKVYNYPAPQVLLTMSSSSNRDAVSDVKWLEDNETVMFLGEHPRELRQLYAFNVRTHVLKKLTHTSTNIVSYGMDSKGNTLAYLVEPPVESIWDAKSRREGFIVSTEWLGDLVTGQRVKTAPLLFSQTGIGVRGQIELSDTVAWFTGNAPSVSPDGKYVVVSTFVRDVPETWKEYSDKLVASMAGRKVAPGQYAYCRRYVVIDTRSGRNLILLNSPTADPASRIAWSPDSHSVVVTHTFLPLDNVAGEERTERRSKWFAVEVNVPSGDFAKVSEEDVKGLFLLGWITKNELVFKASPTNLNLRPGSRVIFRKLTGKWGKITEVKPENSQPDILIEEDINTPPKILATNSANGSKVVLLELNPGFTQLKFGKVEDIHFSDSSGRERKGGLYFPVAYQPGKRYPLVIQTHGWYPDLRRFLVNGFSTTSDAAQTLAGKGIMVLQLNEREPDAADTPKDAPQATAAYEGAIDYLDREGLIDRDRVGVIGFSVTCYYVKYALTHSKYRFAAASVSSGYDGGYFDYILTAPTSYTVARLFEGQNGGLPFGRGLQSWTENSPSFKIDKVHTPLLITALDSYSVILEWEWFAALTRLAKPVEMIYIQGGAHELQKPLDRMVSEGGNVDWFVFWLKGEEDSDAAKAQQYARWREMHKVQEENEKKAKNPSTPQAN